MSGPFWRSRVVPLSVAALLALLWSALLDWRFVFDDYGLAVPQVGIAALGYVAYFGGWIWAILVTAQGGRRGRVALQVYALLLCGYAVLDLVVYCPTTCPGIPLYYVANWANLIIGAAAAFSAFLGVRPAGSPA